MNDEEIDLLLNCREEEVVVKPEDIDVVFKNRVKASSHDRNKIERRLETGIIEAKAVDFNGKSGPIQNNKRPRCNFYVRDSTIAYEFMAQLHYNLEQKELQNKQTRMQKLWRKVKRVTKNLKLKLTILLRL